MLHVVAAAALLALPATPASAAAAPAPTKILFLSDRDGDNDVYAIDPATERIARVTDDDADEEYLYVSPDGSRIEYLVNDPGDQHAEAAWADGTHRRRLDGCDGVASFAPDNRQLACVTGAGIIVFDSDRDAERVLAPDEVADPAWSPDGETVAVPDDTNGLLLFPAAGGAARRLRTPVPVNDFSAPAWSPDSRVIAFVSDRENGSFAGDLYVVPATGGRARRLARNVAQATPAWSPDGNRLLAVDADRPRVLLVGAAGGVRPLGGRSFRAADAAWSPAGDRVVVVRDRPLRVGRYAPGESDLFTVRPDGSGLRRLTFPFPDGGSNGAPVWTYGEIGAGFGRPRLRLAAPRAAAALAFKRVLGPPAADGATVAAGAGQCGGVVWKPLARRRVDLTLCDAGDQADIQSTADYALAGARFAWLWVCGCRYNAGTELDYSDPPYRGAHVLSSGTYYGGDYVDAVVGESRLLAFTVGAKRELWTLGGDARCPGSGAESTLRCRHLAAGDGSTVVDADRDRILLTGDDGTLVVVSADGAVLARWAPAPLRGAAISGGAVVASSGDELRVFDVATGSVRRTWHLAPDVVEPRLEDVNGEVAVYVRGGALHLFDLADGRDVALDIRGQGGWISAELSSAGLAYAYDELGVAKPYRLAWIGRREIRRLLATAG